MPSKKAKNSKKRIEYEHVQDATLSINTAAYFPSDMHFVDPLAVNMPNKGFQTEKKILDFMSKSIKKNPLPIMAIMLIIMIGAVAMTIIYSQVIKPYIAQSQEFELKKLQGNLTSADKPPSLFNFQLPGLSVPGVKGK